MILKDIPSRRYLKVDEEGYFVSDAGARLGDLEFGYEAFDNLQRENNGAFSTTTGDVPAIVEPFDDPFVALQVHKLGSTWTVQMPYGFHREFELETLTLDEWDRFHGRTLDEIPFVFSRNAQSEFFNLVDEFDDESITAGGRKIRIASWLNPSGRNDEGMAQSEGFWSKHYHEMDAPPWDLNEAHPGFQNILKNMKLPRARIAVLGAGRAHDAAMFAQHGHFVTAVDFSSAAIEKARALYGHIENLSFVHADVFGLPASMDGQFDVVVEHTCYCAIPPEKRNDLVKVWRRLLAESGYLFGIFFAMDRPLGPPFGGSEWEIRERLKKPFHFLYWTRWHFSIERRVGTELIVVAQKKN